MKRKTITSGLAVLGAVLGVFSKEFGLSLDPQATLPAVSVLFIYATVEARMDLKRITFQSHKFKDPKFYMALVAGVLPVVDSVFSLGLPVDKIIAGLGSVMGMLFGVSVKKLKKESKEYVKELVRKADEERK